MCATGAGMGFQVSESQPGSVPEPAAAERMCSMCQPGPGLERQLADRWRRIWGQSHTRSSRAASWGQTCEQCYLCFDCASPRAERAQKESIGRKLHRKRVQGEVKSVQRPFSAGDPLFCCSMSLMIMHPQQLQEGLDEVSLDTT